MKKVWDIDSNGNLCLGTGYQVPLGHNNNILVAGLLLDSPEQQITRDQLAAQTSCNPDEMIRKFINRMGEVGFAPYVSYDEHSGTLCLHNQPQDKPQAVAKQTSEDDSSKTVARSTGLTFFGAAQVTKPASEVLEPPQPRKPVQKGWVLNDGDLTFYGDIVSLAKPEYQSLLKLLVGAEKDGILLSTVTKKLSTEYERNFQRSETIALFEELVHDLKTSGPSKAIQGRGMRRAWETLVYNIFTQRFFAAQSKAEAERLKKRPNVTHVASGPEGRD